MTHDERHDLLNSAGTGWDTDLVWQHRVLLEDSTNALRLLAWRLKQAALLPAGAP